MVVPSLLGLTLEGASLQGTPAQVGRFMLGLKVRDAAGTEATSALGLEVNAAAPLVISTTSLPDGQAGAPYSATLESGRRGRAVRAGVLRDRERDDVADHTLLVAAPVAMPER